MNDTEYEAFIQSACDGRVLIGVDRIYARQVYLEMATSAIEEATGEAPHLEKVVVWCAYLASPLAIATSALLIAFTFHWWALLIVPVVLVAWMLNAIYARRGRSSIWLLAVLVIAAMSVHFMNLLANRWVSGLAATFAFALWCDRFLYWAATFFLRAFILRNRRAFEAFREGIRVREEA